MKGATSGTTTLLVADAVSPNITFPSATSTLATLGTNTFVGNQAVTGNTTITGTLSATNLLSGRYTPSITNGTNIASTNAYPLSYMRVGNIVFVGGFIGVDTTATGASSLRISLPIASNFTSSTDAGGSGSRPVNGGANDGWNMYATAATDDITIDGWSMDTALQNLFFTFSYQVL